MRVICRWLHLTENAFERLHELRVRPRILGSFLQELTVHKCDYVINPKGLHKKKLIAFDSLRDHIRQRHRYSDWILKCDSLIVERYSSTHHLTCPPQ